MDPSYKIYPSALNKFQEFLDYEIVVEEPWNKQPFKEVDYSARDTYVWAVKHREALGADAFERIVGILKEESPINEYKLTPAEMQLKLEVDLINGINRIPKGASEAADKGTAFNEIVDCLIEDRGCQRDDMTLTSLEDEKGRKIARATINGQTFDFDVELCAETARLFKGSLPQYLALAHMQTRYGVVEFYGYIDEWMGRLMFDIKTTKEYGFGKYASGWQHVLYPWCVVESGLTTEVESFTYYVVEWASKKMPLTAKNVYYETYSYDHEQAGRRLLQMAERFITWLESRREFIQDKRIFGGENPAGWHGEPLTEQQIEKLKNL